MATTSPSLQMDRQAGREGVFVDFFGISASNQDVVPATFFERCVGSLCSLDRWPFFFVAIGVFVLVGSWPGHNIFDLCSLNLPVVHADTLNI